VIRLVKLLALRSGLQWPSPHEHADGSPPADRKTKAPCTGAFFLDVATVTAHPNVNGLRINEYAGHIESTDSRRRSPDCDGSYWLKMPVFCETAETLIE
jgi:hypothetical protein